MDFNGQRCKIPRSIITSPFAVLSLAFVRGRTKPLHSKDIDVYCGQSS